MTTTFSLVRLFVLGVVANRSRHGYEIVTVAERWGVHRWADISISATYHAIGKLQREGLIEASGTEKLGNRPERQLWGLSEKGSDTLRSYVQYGLSSLNFEGREVDMALAFSHYLDPEVRVECLKRRLGPLRERLIQVQEFHSGYENCLDDPSDSFAEFRQLRAESPWIFAGVKHGLARLELEESWTLNLIEEVSGWPSANAVKEESI